MGVGRGNMIVFPIFPLSVKSFLFLNYIIFLHIIFFWRLFFPSESSDFLFLTWTNCFPVLLHRFSSEIYFIYYSADIVLLYIALSWILCVVWWGGGVVFAFHARYLWVILSESFYGRQIFWVFPCSKILDLAPIFDCKFEWVPDPGL